MDTKILIVRHGQSVANVQNVFVGHMDSPLSELGEKQAELLKEYLSNYTVDAIYSSDLLRAYHTILPYATKKGIPVIKDKRLREICGGDWEGKAYLDLIEKYPVQYAQNWLNDTENTVIPNGETISDAFNRAINVVTEIANKNLGKTVIISAHGGIIRCFECMVQNKKWKDVNWVSNASVSEYAYEDGKFTAINKNINYFLGDLVTKLSKGI